MGLDALGSYISGNIGAVLAGALGIETGPFALPISVLGRLAGAAIGSTIEDYISLADNNKEDTDSSKNCTKTFSPIKPGSSGGSTAGKSFPKSVKNAAKSENPSATCVYCLRPGTANQVDHSIPKAKGGDATLSNAQLTCPHCNASKGARNFPVTPPKDYNGPWPPTHW